jgi:type II secretory pathway pseudopilin PulG
MNYKTEQSGFALLISLIVVGVVLSVGLSILDLSIKQVRLSTNAKESEIAFHAANAGMECARYWRRVNDDEMENGDTISPLCFGATSPYSNTVDDPGPPTYTPVDDTAEAHFYTYSFTWGTESDRCTEVAALVASTTASGGGITISNVDTLIPGYPEPSGNKVCPPGSRCTVLSVRGYNQPCAVASGPGTIQREVLLQF